MMVDGLILRINTKHLRFNERHLMETKEMNQQERLLSPFTEGQVRFPAHVK